MALTSVLLAVFGVLQASPQPAQVKIVPEALELSMESLEVLRAYAYDERGRPIEGRPVYWVSSDERIASVNSDGEVMAMGPGIVRITAIIDRVPGFAMVAVGQNEPASISLHLPLKSVAVGTGAPLYVRVLDRDGFPLTGARVSFESLSPAIATVDEGGRVYGVEPGEAVIRAKADEVSADLEIWVTQNPVTSYEIVPARVAVRTGDVVRFRVEGKGRDGAAVGELMPVWAVVEAGALIEAEASEGVFVAEEVGTYQVMAMIGPESSRTAIVEVEPRGVETQLLQVGRGPISMHNSGDTWVFEGVDGRDYAYVGTFWHDWMKAFDVTDPSNPVLTDSVQFDARRINDVKIHPNNRVAVITREGASTRRNGIVLLDLSDPAHPTIMAEYTETVTGGVHNVWIRGDVDLVYACHNGTSDLHIIDISDPRNPREVNRWGLDKEAKTLHDVIVQDGYAYLSYWDDGVIMLDVGAGTHGGTPTEPAFVSQYKYPIGNTHVSWRAGRYLFVGDEIFPNNWNPSAPIDARGYIHVIDYSDIENPREVARYEVPEAGSHNVWVEDEVLYVGYYQGGLRVVDISGELRGDLYRQGREMAVLKTTDANSVVPNWSMTWGAQVYKGHIYSSDFNSGLWITHLVESPALMP